MKKVTKPVQSKLIPEKEIKIKDGYRWFTYSQKDTGLKLICLEDLATGIVVTTTIADPKKRVAAHRAWAGARHSRAPGAPWQILYEMGEKGIDPDQKLDDTFRNYGHKSVGDMARLEISTHGTPMHACLAFFNNACLNGGQEKSTRYQSKFKEALLHPLKNYLPPDFPAGDLAKLEESYQSFGKKSLELYNEYREKIAASFRDYFQPSEEQISALNSRVMDCVRFFLLFGQCSGFSLDTSARDWSRIISEMKASPIPLYKRVALQVESLFTPPKEIEESLGFKAEAPSLIRHSEAASLTNENISKLHTFIKKETDFLKKVPIRKKFRGLVKQSVELVPKKYSQVDRLVAQYLFTIWPGADRKSLLEWVHVQKNKLKKNISRIIFSGHNHNHELPLWTGTSDTTLIFQSFLGENRDWNRHRAQRRFMSLPMVYGEKWTADTAAQVLAQGFGLPLYLMEIPHFSTLAKDFERSLTAYYGELYKFLDLLKEKYGDSIDYELILNLLPLAHQVDLWMHGDPKQSLYLTHLRVRPGGHINYRALAFQANQLIAKSNPYLVGLKLSKKPDPKNREEFFDRS